MAVFRIVVKKNEIDDYFKSMKKKFSGAPMRAFMGKQRPKMTTNIKDCFRRKVWRNELGSVENWAELKDATKQKRIKKSTWHGDTDSILTEYYTMSKNALRGHKVLVKKGMYILRVFPTSPKEEKKMGYHEAGIPGKMQPRPPYSILKETEDKLEKSFWGYVNKK